MYWPNSPKYKLHITYINNQFMLFKSSYMILCSWSLAASLTASRLMGAMIRRSESAAKAEMGCQTEVQVRRVSLFFRLGFFIWIQFIRTLKQDLINSEFQQKLMAQNQLFLSLRPLELNPYLTYFRFRTQTMNHCLQNPFPVKNSFRSIRQFLLYSYIFNLFLFINVFFIIFCFPQYSPKIIQLSKQQYILLEYPLPHKIILFQLIIFATSYSKSVRSAIRLLLLLIIILLLQLFLFALAFSHRQFIFAFEFLFHEISRYLNSYELYCREAFQFFDSDELSFRFAIKNKFYVTQNLFYQKLLNQLNRNMSQRKDKSNCSDYKCTQVFGYKGSNQKIHEEDIITTLKFSQDGKNLAVGDKAGRIIVFQTLNAKKVDQKFNYLTEFQAYNRQFDPLNSTDIDEEVIGLSWMRAQGNYQKMLTMNSKYVKVWKIYQKPKRKMVKSLGKDLTFPKFQAIENSVQAEVQKTFPIAHEQDLIGMEQTNNQQYIICTDTVKAILWNFQKSSTPFLVTDLQKGKPIQEVKQTINCMRTHPNSDSIFAYGTNKGSVVLSDTRISASYKPLTFKIESSKEKTNFFTQMISSYSSLAFFNNNKYIASRDFLTVKVWDVSKTDKPLLSITIQDAIKSKLCQIFENDCIFDKFNIAISKDSNTLLTGNYNNCFHAIDVNNSANTQYEINYKKQTITRPMIPGKQNSIGKMDYSRKTVALDFNPTTNMLAIASLNCFATYSM